MAETPDNLSGLKLLDTATEITRWNNEAHAIGLKVLEERSKEEKARQEEVARLKRPMHSLHFAPVPTAKTVVAENVAKLYLLTQKRNVQPVFEFSEEGVQAFGAVLRVCGTVFRAEGVFSSKKEAKEAVARLGVEFLMKNPGVGLESPSSRASLRASSMAGGGVPFGGQGAVSELNLKCQKLKLLGPEYIIPEIAQGQFSAKMVLGGHFFEEQGPFPSKKLAKEAVARHGLAHFENMLTPPKANTSSVELERKLHSMIDRHRLDAPKFEITELNSKPLTYRVQLHLDSSTIENPGPFSTKQDARSAITVQAIVHLEQKYKEDDENWIELLNLFAQSTIRQPPTYVDFQETATKQDLWASEVHIAPFHPSPFGRRDVPFHSKKLARQSAAREAVQWLRANEHIPEEGPPTKKLKMKQASGASSEGEGQEIGYAQQVNDLCIRHNIHVPIYEITAAPDGPFFSGHARFTGVPFIGGGRPMGHVVGVFGRRNAKEAVARNLVRWLGEWVREREGEGVLFEGGLLEGGDVLWVLD